LAVARSRFAHYTLSTTTVTIQTEPGDPNELPSEENINARFPFGLVELSYLPGELIEADHRFDGFQEFAPMLRYDYILGGKDLTPLFKSSSAHKGRSQVVGGAICVDRGVIVFSPAPKQWQNTTGIYAYLEAIASLPELLARTSNAVPDWADAFQSQREREAVTEISSLDRKIAALQRRREEVIGLVSAEKHLKLLYTGTGGSILEITMEALREFGLNVVEGPHPRADLLVWDGGHRLAAAEVKGLDGPARESNHRQAIRWAADVNAALAARREDRDADLALYAEKLGELGLDVDTPTTEIECRGLMIIGTYRQTPLGTRSADSFPDPVTRAIARSNVCALTGLDLYCLLHEVRADPNRKAEVDQLFSINGVIAPADWRSVISEEHPKAAK
jgi:hypothetical protein